MKEKDKSKYVYFESNSGIYKMERVKLLQHLEMWDEFVIRLKELE